MSDETVSVKCPNCGKSIEIDMEGLPEDQSSMEDCSACREGMELYVRRVNGRLQVTASKLSE